MSERGPGATVVAFPASRKLARMTPGSSSAAPPAARAAPDEDWGRLMVAAQDGDRDAYARLLTSVTPYVRAIARRYVAVHDVEDAVQDVLLAVHTVRHTFEPGRALKPWLAAIASRRCIDLARSAGRRAATEVEDEAATDAAAHGDHDPQAAAAVDLDARRLRRALRDLPPGQRQAIELLKLDELSLKDAAGSTQLSVAALKVACHRAIRSLRRSLAAPEELDHDEHA